MKTFLIFAAIALGLSCSVAQAAQYGRPVVIDSGGTSQVRIYDVVDTAVFDPRPSWGKTDDALLTGMFKPNKAAWAAAGQWFVAVPAGVQAGAIHVGSDYGAASSYTNPDGTDGDGKPIK